MSKIWKFYSTARIKASEAQEKDRSASLMATLMQELTAIVLPNEDH